MFNKTVLLNNYKPNQNEQPFDCKPIYYRITARFYSFSTKQNYHMKLKFNFKTLFVGFLAVSVLTMSACTKEFWLNIGETALEVAMNDALSDVLGDDMDVENLSTLFGWQESDENMEEIESDISFSSFGSGTLPSSVDLTAHFPPIGNQGKYGTCVAWAVGYNMKTYLDALDRGLSSTELAQKSNQSSPKDLFWAIANTDKGGDCNGTNFEFALDILQSRGVATLADVPYTNLGNCSDSPEAGWNTAAANWKIENYRKVGDDYEMDLATIKGYLAQNRPVVIGARLGDKFMATNDATILSYETYEYAGQHAYHAMILSGYDDNKKAFRVVNSWAPSWGDNGYIWVDYDFFVDEFCFAAFVATNKKANPDDDGNNQVDPDDIADGSDLVAWELEDKPNDEFPNDPLRRAAVYNVFNSGESTINASQDWNILYLYYNAYDADDYGILLYDVYTDDYGSLGEDGLLEDVETNSDLFYGAVGNWWNYINVASGQSVAAALYNDDDSRFSFTYTMPTSITGDYYLVLIADGFDVIKEADEANNYFYFTGPDDAPITITNGVISGLTSKKSLLSKVTKPERYAASPKASAISKTTLNTYSTSEIRGMLNHEFETGALQAKVDEYLAKSKGTKTRY